MLPSFETKGDAMPLDVLGFSTRSKIIHSVGVVGKVLFKPFGGSPYTGIFKGANSGIIRFSSAAEPS